VRVNFPVQKGVTAQASVATMQNWSNTGAHKYHTDGYAYNFTFRMSAMSVIKIGGEKGLFITFRPENRILKTRHTHTNSPKLPGISLCRIPVTTITDTSTL
jgi:hypothetical protein